MQRLRAWMRQWLGVEALEAKHASLWAEYRQMTLVTLSPDAMDSLTEAWTRHQARTPPTPETPKATATPSEPEFFDPVMGRL